MGIISKNTILCNSCRTLHSFEDGDATTISTYLLETNTTGGGQHIIIRSTDKTIECPHCGYATYLGSQTELIRTLSESEVEKAYKDLLFFNQLSRIDLTEENLIPKELVDYIKKQSKK